MKDVWLRTVKQTLLIIYSHGCQIWTQIWTNFHKMGEMGLLKNCFRTFRFNDLKKPHIYPMSPNFEATPTPLHPGSFELYQ